MSRVIKFREVLAFPFKVLSSIFGVLMMACIFLVAMISRIPIDEFCKKLDLIIYILEGREDKSLTQAERDALGAIVRVQGTIKLHNLISSGPLRSDYIPLMVKDGIRGRNDAIERRSLLREILNNIQDEVDLAFDGSLEEKMIVMATVNAMINSGYRNIGIEKLRELDEKEGCA